MGDFSYLFKRSRCLLLLSFVSRQRLELWTELRRVDWFWFFISCPPPSGCDSDVLLGLDI